MDSSTSFELDKNKVDEVQRMFLEAKISQDQMEIITEFANILHESTNLAIKNLKGFIYIAIISWQEENNMILKEVTDFDPENREAVVRDISERLKFMLRSMLVLPDQQVKLEQGLEKGFEIYRKKWKYR